MFVPHFPLILLSLPLPFPSLFLPSPFPISAQHTPNTAQHASTERVWGAAYHIPSSHVASVREYLDIREINGYSIQFTPFHAAANNTIITSPPVEETETETEKEGGFWGGESSMISLPVYRGGGDKGEGLISIQVSGKLPPPP